LKERKEKLKNRPPHPTAGVGGGCSSLLGRGKTAFAVSVADQGGGGGELRQGQGLRCAGGREW